MELNDIRNKHKIAIVVVGYNRVNSIARLLNSLLIAKYPEISIPLYISIDASGDTTLYDYVKSFQWPYGDKYLNIQTERLGLRKHIIQCGDLTRFFKAVILLEDDIFVGESFYDYVQNVVDYYWEETRLAGFSLINSEMGFPGLPMMTMQDGCDVFLKQFPASWGECWTSLQWDSFKEWYKDFNENDIVNYDIPERVKAWKKAWSKFFIAYMVETGRYFLYPQVSRTTCFGDAGEHSTNSSNFGQVNLLCGKPHYYFKQFDEMLKYDVYGVNESIYKWIGLKRDELCVDFHCCNNNRRCRYLLTPAVLPLKVVKSYGLMMRPIELNVKYNLSGNELFLYDTSDSSEMIGRTMLPGTISNYYLRGYNIKLAIKYVYNYYKEAIRRKLYRKH